MNHLEEALDLARRRGARLSPNPAVGAVVVRDDEVVGRGFHTWAGLKHAEVLALEEAGERARGATLYVTWNRARTMAARRPASTRLSRRESVKSSPPWRIRIRRQRRGDFTRLRDAGIEVEIAPSYAARATEINEPFIHFMRTGRPLVTLKAARDAGRKDRRARTTMQGWITSETARAHVQTLRHRFGRDSHRHRHGAGRRLPAHGPYRPEERSRPLLRIVLDSLLRLPSESWLVTSCRERCAGGDHLRRIAGAPQAPGSQGRARRSAGGRRRPRGPGGRGGTAGAGKISFADDRSRQPRQLELRSNPASPTRSTSITRPRFWAARSRLPVAGGAGRRRRADAIQFHDVKLHPIATDEFAVEAWVESASRSRCSPESSKSSAGRHGVGTRSEVRARDPVPTVLSDRAGSSIAVNGVCLTALELTPNALPPTWRRKLCRAAILAISSRARA